jgi:dethiobiotin synthetase
MSDDRIRITVDDVARIGDLSVPEHGSVGVNTPLTNAPHPIRSRSKHVSPVLVVVGIVVGIITLTLIAALVFSDHQENMESWVQNQRKVYDDELLNSSEPKKMIENIHPFVTFLSANVKSKSR